MNRFLFLCLTILATLTDARAHTRPNIVFIYTDDQAPHAVNAAGDERFLTPHIDRIFHEGADFTNGFVTTPVCSPSRAGLMTSRYGTELGITDWINPQREPSLGLDPDLPTWPRLLAGSGYRTGLFGKWHLGTDDQYHPSRFGYQTFMGIREGGCPPKDPVLETFDGTVRQVEGYTCDIFTDHALDFIRKNDDKPFLVSLHFRAPHAAWLPVRPEDWEPFKDLDPEIPNPDFPNLDTELVKKRTREYLAAVKSVDRNVGRVLALLDERDLTENTVVVFTSDHGYNLGEHGVWFKGNAHHILTENPPKKWDHIPRGRRPNLWDTSLRVPMAIRWPGVVAPGRKIEHTVTNLDWFPTLLAMAGVELPEGIRLHGRDMTPLLRGQAVEWDDDLYAEYSMHHGARTHMRAYRTPQWKYMRDLAHPGREELYDLVRDPDEMNNLAESQEAEHRRMKRILGEKILAKMKELNDPALPENEAPAVNVLFIISDDLTATALSCYGNTVCRTPNIDALAARGTRFTRAYCQGTYCGPSRASLLSGYYPHATGVHGYTSPRPAIGDRATWPQHFKQAGYHTARVSKIFHMGVPGGIEKGDDGADDPASWTERFNSPGPEWRAPGNGETLEGNPEGSKPVMGGNTFVVVEAEGDDMVHSDGKTAARAAALIDDFKDKRFFLAVGFVRPHVPFVAPRAYFEPFLPYGKLSLPEKIEGDWDDIPRAGINYKTSVNMQMDLRRQRKALGGYYASVAFMDAQVGKVLDALRRAGLEDRTIVILTSDHGYHLGEHDFWAKVSLHEESAAVPLIIRVPGKAPAVCHSLTELIDLYPTVSKLCGLEVPERLQGKDIAPMLDDPSYEVRDTAFCVNGENKGFLLREKRWAYIQYGEDAGRGVELFDMENDPKQYTNLADRADQQTRVAAFKAKLQEKLDAVRRNDLE